jgi:hypothetical protein
MLVTTHMCFGWAIQHFKLSAGEQFVVLARDNIPRSDMSAKTFYTVGRMNAAHELTGVYTPDRPAGFFSPNELPDVLTRGKTTLTAVTDSEWWCLEGKLAANKGKAPVMTPVVLEQGQSAQLPVGTKLLVCEGSGTIGNQTFSQAQAVTIATEEKALVATSKFFGLIFDSSNPAA